MIKKIFYRLLCLLPIKKNKIIFWGYYGAQYGCSPKYISEYLYRHGQIMKQKKEQNRENAIKKKENELRAKSQNIVNPVSKTIIENKMKVKLSMIFEQFDKNQNGKISADEIDLEKVPMDLIVIFKPLLLEMEAYQESLDRDEFVESSMALISVSKTFLLIFNF